MSKRIWKLPGDRGADDDVGTTPVGRVEEPSSAPLRRQHAHPIDLARESRILGKILTLDLNHAEQSRQRLPWRVAHETGGRPGQQASPLDRGGDLPDLG